MSNTAQARGTGVPPVFISRFPLTLSIATILTTSLGLLAATLNLQWSIPSLTRDALPLAWLYVNIPLLFTTLALFPALSLKSKSRGIKSLGSSTADSTPTRRTLLFLNLPALFIAAIPALSVAAFLSNITLPTALATLALQLSAALLAASIISWHHKISAPLITGLLTTLAVILPLLAYLWSEFLPLAPQSFLHLTPMLALNDAITSPPTSLFYGTLTLYTLLGALLLTTVPQTKAPPPPPRHSLTH